MINYGHTSPTNSISMHASSETKFVNLQLTPTRTVYNPLIRTQSNAHYSPLPHGPRPSDTTHTTWIQTNPVSTTNPRGQPLLHNRSNCLERSKQNTTHTRNSPGDLLISPISVPSKIMPHQTTASRLIGSFGVFVLGSRTSTRRMTDSAR